MRRIKAWVGMTTAGAILASAATIHAQAPSPPSQSKPPTAAAPPSPAWRRAEAAAIALRDRALQGSDAYAFLSALTTTFGPRLAGSQSEHRAAHWAVDQLKAHGFANVHIESFPVPGWTRGEERAEIVSPAPQPLRLTALGGSGATPDAGITGDVVLFHTYAAMLASTSGSLSGKIVVVTQPMARTQDGSGYGALGVMRFQGAAEAAKRGAAVYLIRSLSTVDDRLPHTGVTRFPDGMAPIPAAALSVPDAEQLDRVATLGQPMRLHVVLTPHFTPGATAETVVADIPGRERPDEVVLIGGHLDSWDLGTGAIDDGAGVAITTAAAKLIQAMPQAPRRTVRLVLFGAEEIDYAGPAFAKLRSAAQQGQIVIASECDFGAEPPYAIALPKGGADSAFAHALASAVAPIPTFIVPEPARDGGEDMAELKGVPLAELIQNGTHYFDIHHSADDTLNQVDHRQLDKAVADWAAFIYLAADTDVDFRKP